MCSSEASASASSWSSFLRGPSMAGSSARPTSPSAKIVFAASCPSPHWSFASPQTIRNNPPIEIRKVIDRRNAIAGFMQEVGPCRWVGTGRHPAERRIRSLAYTRWHVERMTS